MENKPVKNNSLPLTNWRDVSFTNRFGFRTRKPIVRDLLRCFIISSNSFPWVCKFRPADLNEDDKTSLFKVETFAPITFVVAVAVDKRSKNTSNVLLLFILVTVIAVKMDVLY